jgi:ADP-ribose pyrophosphatase
MNDPTADRVLYRSHRLTLVERDLPHHDGSTTTRAFVRHPGSVVVLPLLPDGRLLLLHNHRHTLGRALWELPAGTLDPNEPIESCAARELEEETGYLAETLEPLLSFYAAPGSSDERMHAFVATGLRATAQRLDPTERIDVHAVSVERAFEMAREGAIEDAKSLVVLLAWSQWWRGGQGHDRSAARST